MECDEFDSIKTVIGDQGWVEEKFIESIQKRSEQI